MIYTVHDLPAITASVESRTIEGLAVPWNDPGRPMGTGSLRGKGLSFLPGSLDRSLKARASKVRLLVQHDPARPIGRLVDWDNMASGLQTRWKLASTPSADIALTEASEGIRDGLSVGVEVLDYEDRPDVVNVIEAKLVEVSLVTIPAYDIARVSHVAASLETGRDPRSMRLNLLLKGTP